ncbi:hypothetical protein FSARC_330 [Fusarium sarcochroum]|uniref:Uncharacterized protein n=1 Tax=Fusarium sarcochroum TaxID=1208366 RepID=A0A8H4XFL0_9HYPO|nr:hypothetical protein FSARC_330 [Fusarium sarcochroum]
MTEHTIMRKHVFLLHVGGHTYTARFSFIQSISFPLFVYDRSLPQHIDRIMAQATESQVLVALAAYRAHINDADYKAMKEIVACIEATHIEEDDLDQDQNENQFKLEHFGEILATDIQPPLQRPSDLLGSGNAAWSYAFYGRRKEDESQSWSWWYGVVIDVGCEIFDNVVTALDRYKLHNTPDENNVDYAVHTLLNT